MRGLLTFILLLILIALVGVYFLPGTIHIEKSMVLKAQPEVVFQNLNTTTEWKNWAAWLKEDAMNEIAYHGPETDAGAALSWNSKVPEISTGNVMLQSSQPATQVKAEIEFDKYGKSQNTYVLGKTGNGTQTTWTLDLNVADKGFPTGWVNKVKALSWKKTIDTWMDASLKNLDEATADAQYYPKPTVNDTLVNKLDSLNRKVDSLKNTKEKDTVYLIP